MHHIAYYVILKRFCGATLIICKVPGCASFIAGFQGLVPYMLAEGVM